MAHDNNRDVKAKEFDDWAEDVLAHEAARRGMGPEPLDDSAFDFTPVPPEPVPGPHDAATGAILDGPSVSEPQPALGYRSCYGFACEDVNAYLVIEYDVDRPYNTKRHRNPIRGRGIAIAFGTAYCDDAAANLRAIADLLAHADEYIESAPDHPEMAPAHIVRGALEEAVRRGGMFYNPW